MTACVDTANVDHSEGKCPRYFYLVMTSGKPEACSSDHGQRDE
jgi:hypothetical protein